MDIHREFGALDATTENKSSEYLSRMKFFSHTSIFFCDSFDPANMFFDNKITSFQDDISDISAETATLSIIGC